jgi:isocitrate dehydrogenase
MGDTQTTNPKSPAGLDEDPAKIPALYDRFAERSRELFEQGQEQGREAWGKAMDLSREQLAAAGEFSGEQGEAFKRYMSRDLHQTAEDMRTLGTEAKERFNPARLGAGALSSVAKLLHAAGGAAVALSNRAEESLVYNTGEITMAGSLTCSTCGHKSQLKVTSVVPTCSECQGTRFRKSY